MTRNEFLNDVNRGLLFSDFFFSNATPASASTRKCCDRKSHDREAGQGNKYIVPCGNDYAGAILPLEQGFKSCTFSSIASAAAESLRLSQKTSWAEYVRLRQLDRPAHMPGRCIRRIDRI